MGFYLPCGLVISTMNWPLLLVWYLLLWIDKCYWGLFVAILLMWIKLILLIVCITTTTYISTLDWLCCCRLHSNTDDHNGRLVVLTNMQDCTVTLDCIDTVNWRVTVDCIASLLLWIAYISYCPLPGWIAICRTGQNTIPSSVASSSAVETTTPGTIWHHLQLQLIL